MSDLLRRAHGILLEEHSGLSLEYGQMIPWGKQYHDEDICDVCDLLREIDKSLETPPGHICDCHSL